MGKEGKKAEESTFASILLSYGTPSMCAPIALLEPGDCLREAGRRRTPASQRRNRVSGKRKDLLRVREHTHGRGRIELGDSPPQGSFPGEKEPGSGRKKPTVSGFHGGQPHRERREGRAWGPGSLHSDEGQSAGPPVPSHHAGHRWWLAQEDRSSPRPVRHTGCLTSKQK